jgi:DNA (cytosine-5)-methyltransferase 1
MRKRPDITPKCWLKKKTGSTDVFGRMRWDEAAPTIRTEFFKPEKGRYLHPQAHRPITIREAARLQTFSDAFIFVGSNVQVAKQIGNAVPVKLAEAIAQHLKSLLARSAKETKKRSKRIAAAS